MNKQKFLDETFRKLVDQYEVDGIIAVRTSGECVYNARDGGGCAIGVWIPPSERNPLWDDEVGLGVTSVLSVEQCKRDSGTDRFDTKMALRNAVLEYIHPEDNDDWHFLGEVQSAHDNAAKDYEYSDAAIGFVNTLRDNFKYVADAYGLTPPQ